MVKTKRGAAETHGGRGRRGADDCKWAVGGRRQRTPRVCARARSAKESGIPPRAAVWGPSAARLARPAHPTLWVTTDKQARAVAEAWPTKAPCVAAQQSRRIGTPYDGVVLCTLYVCYVFVYTVYL